MFEGMLTMRSLAEELSHCGLYNHIKPILILILVWTIGANGANSRVVKVTDAGENNFAIALDSRWEDGILRGVGWDV
jgi:hypothetical protein